MSIPSSFGKPLTTAERKKQRAVLADRARGLYNTKDTQDEVKQILGQMEPTDVAFTLIRRIGGFSVFNKSEFIPQVSQWAKMGAKLLDGNVFEKVIEGKTFYLFVIQPKTETELESMGLCPLALAYGIMVSGYTYVTPSKAVVEIVKRALA